MKQILFIIFTILTLNLTYSQSDYKNCDCIKNTFTEEKADTSFHFSNGKIIVLCGYRNDETENINYSEFVLYVCGEKEIINFWGAVETCNVKVKNDTLYVEELINLPNGKNFKFEESVWWTDKYYFEGDNLQKKSSINKEIKKYDNDEINIVLKEFESRKKGLDDNIMELGYKLFICSISGNHIAQQYFKDFETKFGTLDGYYKESYNDLTAMLEIWNK